MTITMQQVRDAISRAERHNPTATELSHGRAHISEGDLFVLIEAAKCATFKDTSVNARQRSESDFILSAQEEGTTLKRL